jgi:hypothetical protein
VAEREAGVAAERRETLARRLLVADEQDALGRDPLLPLRRAGRDGTSQDRVGRAVPAHHVECDALLEHGRSAERGARPLPSG